MIDSHTATCRLQGKVRKRYDGAAGVESAANWRLN
jgi:hypothetical protein